MLHGPGAGPALKCTTAIWWYNSGTTVVSRPAQTHETRCPTDFVLLLIPRCCATRVAGRPQTAVNSWPAWWWEWLPFGTAHTVKWYFRNPNWETIYSFYSRWRQYCVTIHTAREKKTWTNLSMHHCWKYWMTTHHQDSPSSTNDIHPSNIYKWQLISLSINLPIISW